jgi:CelD/BcsL family acetyltransferase involved in cellulose biosynthesis
MLCEPRRLAQPTSVRWRGPVPGATCDSPSGRPTLAAWDGADRDNAGAVRIDVSGVDYRGAALFEYVRNEFNPEPSLVLAGTPAPPDKLVADIPYSVSLVMPLPRSPAELQALRSRKYWSKMRRTERLLAEQGADIAFEVVTEPERLRVVLPRVRRLFAERWSAEYTSFAWKTPEGFAPYADAMLRLAGEGRGEVVALWDGADLISFAYCLLEDRTYHFFQHASTTAERYRRHSVGKILIARLLADLARDDRADTMDFMTGAAAYKREWASDERPILRRVVADRSARGLVQLAARSAAVRLKFTVQFGHPLLRSAAKAALLAFERWRSGPAAPAAPQPAFTRWAAAQPERTTEKTRTP